jgi:tetratricopeptide (TPR) repeat protein
MARATAAVFFLLFSFASFAQSDAVKNIVREGIALHDAHNYEEAIAKYQEALKLDSASSLVHYEMALTYYHMKEYEKVIFHAKTAIDQNNDIALSAIIVMGSALDDSGRTNESVDLYKEALNRYPNEYLLLFNYAISSLRLNRVDEAERALVQGISANLGHASSHLRLGYIQKEKGERIKSLLCLYFFMMLENNTERAAEAYSQLVNLFYKGVKRDAENPNNITINLSANDKGGFDSGELMLSVIAAASLDKHKDKNEFERFAADTQSFFQILGELKEKESKKKKSKKKGKEQQSPDLWNYYTDFFYELSKAGFTEVLCYHAGVASKNEIPVKWMEANQEKMELFQVWLRNQ